MTEADEQAREFALGQLLARAKQVVDDPLAFAKMLMDYETSLTGAQLLVHALARVHFSGSIVVPRSDIGTKVLDGIAFNGRVDSLEIGTDPKTGDVTVLIRPHNRAERRARE